MSSRPLPQPVVLPSRFAPLARAITGRTQLPRFTSGVATRAALRASGARAATTGVTLHLPLPPDGSPRTRSLVAHELSHIRDAVRPRSTGLANRAAAGHGSKSRLANRADSRPHFLLEGLSGVVDAGERRARAVGKTVTDTVTDTGSSLARNAVSAIEQRTPLVRDLPVGGLSSLLSRASAVAKETAMEVAEQAAALPAKADGVLSSAGETGRGLLHSVGDPAAMVAGAADRAEAGAGAWQSPAAGGLPSPQSEASTSASPAPSGGTADLAGRADELLEILEDRLIAELERRGGRFAGVF